MESIIKKADILIEAIPYIHEFRQKVFVIKYGGSILENDQVRRSVLEDLVFLSYVGIRPVLIHGGGPHISARLREIGVEPRFENGIRVTDDVTLKIVEEEMAELNHRIVEEIKSLRGDVVGIPGFDDLIYATKKQSTVDLGSVGSVTSVNAEKILTNSRQGHIVVMTPMGKDENGQHYNINADESASEAAKALKAEKFVLMTDVQGVMKDPNDKDSLISSLTLDDVHTLIDNGTIHGGMIPKVTSCLKALEVGIHKTHIVDARIPRALLLEFFTDQGVGTQIIAE